MIDALAVGENAVETVELLRVRGAAGGIVNHQPHGAATFRRDALGHFFRAGKHLGQAAMDAAGIGTALGLLGLEFVQFGQHIDRDAEVVFLEPFQRCRVVQQHVGVQDVVFSDLGRGLEAEVGGLGGLSGSSLLATAASCCWDFFKQCGLSFLGAINHRDACLGIG